MFEELKRNIVLDKTVQGFGGVRLENRKFFSAPGLRTKDFERFYLSFNKQFY